jgi:DNA polymerase-3 subunit delta'
MKFQDIKGHKKNIEILRGLVERDTIPSSLIFYGPEGSGKLLVAKALARDILSRYVLPHSEDLLFGISENTASNDDAESIRMFDAGVHPDFIVVDLKYQSALLNEKVDEQKSIKIDTVRELIKFSNLKPSYSTKKVIIVDDAEKMTVDAQNSILKTLEEPPENTIIILVTQNINLLLQTIVSRCYTMKFTGLDKNNIIDILVSKGYDMKKAELLSEMSEGSVSTALIYDDIIKMIEENLEYKNLAPFLIVSKISKTSNFRHMTDTIISFVNAYIYSKIDTPDKREELLSFLKENFKYKNYLKHNVNTRIILTMVLHRFFKTFNYFNDGIVLKV